MKKKGDLLTFISILMFSVIIGMRFNAVAVTSLDGANFSKNCQTNFRIASPKTIWVPDNYTKIQWAVGNATSGDTVFVAAGTYYEQVTLNKSLTLIGENPNTTIIDGFAITDGDYVIKCTARHINISGFTIRNGKRGIGLDHSDNVTVSGNTITNNGQFGIFLVFSSNNTVHNNTVSNNGDRGIYLRYSNNNYVISNTVSHHKERGILLFGSTDNVIDGNTISDTNQIGILCGEAGGPSENNTIRGNTVLNNTYGISIRTSTGNTLRNNKMNGNRYNFDINAVALGQYIHNIDPSNTVNGKPMYYWINQANKQVPAGAGYVAVINSKNITVKDQTLTNNAQGVLLAYTTNSTIVNVNASYNHIGIHIIEDLYIPPKSGNNVIKNNILTNNYEGIEFTYSSDNVFNGNTVTKNYYGVNSAFCNNTLYHNNFIDNINLTYRNISLSIINIWDNGYPSGGNYWSDYTARGGYDNNGDGIGDVPYVIDDKNQDNFPLMAPVVSVDQLNISDDRCDVGSLQTVAFHAVWAHNSSDVVEGSVYVNGTRYVTNSTGWVSFNAAYETVGKRVWAITGSISFYTIWDRIHITLSVSDNRINVGGNATIAWSAEYEYDGSAFEGFLTLNDTQTLYNTVGKRGYTVLSVSDPVYGLTNFTSNSVHCIWDRIKIIDGGVSKTQTSVNQEETVWFKTIYEYGNVAFDGTKGKLYVNGSEMTWSSENNRWEYSCSFGTAGTRIFQVTGVTDNQYALTAINDAVGALSVTWTEAVQFWMQWWFWMAVGAGTIVVIAIYLLKLRKK